MSKEWTIGRGVAVGLKWIAIMGIVITIFAFFQFLIKFQGGYYDKERCIDCPYPVREPVPVIVGSCEAVTSDYRDDCCQRQFGSESYWDSNRCVLKVMEDEDG